jgi:DNA-binding LytR/AlgR family response regulator
MADLRKGMNLGADDYIVKPFKYDDLLIAIETRLKRKAASGTGSKPNKSSSKSVIKEDELWIESEDAIEKYPVKSIIYLSKILNGTVLYIDALGEKVALNQDFDKLINLLAPLQFKQINENVAVNTGFIDTVRRSGINAGELVMKSVIKPFTIEPGFLSGFDNY